MLFTATQAADNADIKIAQWNIHFGTDVNFVPALQEQAAVVRKLDADVVALNEVDKKCSRSNYVDMAGIIAKEANMPYVQFAAAFILPPEGLYGNAIMSRYPMELVGAWAIPAPPQETRAVALVKVNAPKKFLLAVTHLNPHGGEENEKFRVLAVNFIDEILKKNNPDDLPMVLLGDFNCQEASEPVAIMRKQNWQSGAFLPSWPTGKAYAALDHFYWYGKNCQLVERFAVSDINGASDHLPLINIIRINDNK